MAEDVTLWREVVQLAVGQLMRTPFMLWSVLEALVPESPSDAPGLEDPGFERALYAALAVEETGVWRRVPLLGRSRSIPSSSKAFQSAAIP